MESRDTVGWDREGASEREVSRLGGGIAYWGREGCRARVAPVCESWAEPNRCCS